MKTCAEFIDLAKTRLGKPRMSDRELGEILGGWSQPAVAAGKIGRCSDPLAMALADAAGVHPGAVLIAARVERERDAPVKAALKDWAEKNRHPVYLGKRTA